MRWRTDRLELLAVFKAPAPLVPNPNMARDGMGWDGREIWRERQEFYRTKIESRISIARARLLPESQLPTGAFYPFA